MIKFVFLVMAAIFSLEVYADEAAGGIPPAPPAQPAQTAPEAPANGNVTADREPARRRKKKKKKHHRRHRHH